MVHMSNLFWCVVFFVYNFECSCFSDAFVQHSGHPCTRTPFVTRTETTTTLWMAASKKKNTKKNKSRIKAPTAGFGAAATDPCPCGSSLGYMKCCGRLHTNEDAYASASAEQVVRARYSAYAKRVVDFVVGSTHPLNKNFQADIEHWKKTIDENCYDNFELTSCKILEESYDGEGMTQVATVKFVAEMIQVDSRERTAFMETCTFERIGENVRKGAWLYKDGIIEPPPEEVLTVSFTEDDKEQPSTSIDVEMP